MKAATWLAASIKIVHIHKYHAHAFKILHNYWDFVLFSRDIFFQTSTIKSMNYDLNATQ